MNLFARAARWSQGAPRRAYVALPLLLMVALYWLSSIPGIPQPDDPAQYALFYWISPTVQNVLHVPVYAALSWAWHWALGAWHCRSTARAIGACVIASAYGVLDEWHQSFVPGRYASFADVALDVAGAVLGVCLGVWLGSRAWTARIDDGHR